MALCGACGHDDVNPVSVFAREFLHDADIPAFRRAYRQGIVYVADRTTTPWSPVLFDVPEPVPGNDAYLEDYYEELGGHYVDLLRYYSQVVGQR